MSERGEDFVAVVRLSTKAGATLALPGESCGKVPDASLEWLERKGKIRRAASETAGGGPAFSRRPRRHEGGA